MKFSRYRVSDATALCLMLALAATVFPAAAQEPRPVPARALISLGEAQAIINRAIEYTNELGLIMAVVVVDQSGYVVSSARMDGAPFRNMRFAQGKAFASAIYGQTTEELGALATTRPDRYFGILGMYPGELYLVGGGVPLAVDGVIVGAVGIAGLPQGVDEMAGRAGMEAWVEYRASMER
jgi:glc operon protein GlcG